MRPGPIGAACKRALDITGAVCGLLVLFPVMFVVALAVWFSMGRPILFHQIRAGLHGRPFILIKFRTMLVSSSVDIDPSTDSIRITRLGNLLRNLSLDELPQLWNVLKGEMSLVGPRPLPMEYLAHYTADQSRRHLMKPGITGLAQIKGRNAAAWEEKFSWDLRYIDHWSIALDLQILLFTVGTVIKREGISRQGHVTTEKFGA
jgi:sugar transferase EpsL